MRPYLILSFILLVLFSCRKDNVEVVNSNINIPEPRLSVEVDGQGFVFDQDGNAIEGARVRLGAESIFTDEQGYFEIKALTRDDLATFKVEANGFFTSFPTIKPIKGKTHELRVQMQKRDLSLTISSQTGGTVALSNGSEVSFAANAFETMDGAAYSGNVNVYSYYLDPTREDLYEVMPGNLTAVNQASEIQLLQSFAMMNVELETDAGEALQINQDAQLIFDVPDALVTIAPAEIPLWYFDEQSGYWIEEGKAQLSNGLYMGNVSHFSFWNCDVPNDFIDLTGQIVDPRAESVFQVCITQVSTGIEICSNTTQDGYFDGFVPNDEDLIINVYDHCRSPLYTDNIGPYNDDTNLGVITVSANNSVSLISGSVVDCDGNTVSNGRVYVKLDNDPLAQMITISPDGSFSSLISVCNSTEVIIKAFDLEKLVESDALIFTIEPTINSGTIAACGNQIAVGVEFDFDPNLYRFYTPVTLTRSGQSPQDSSHIYEFEYTADLGGGDKIVYTHTFINWTASPANPLWAHAYTTEIFGAPSEIVVPEGGDFQVLQYGLEVGDAFIIEMTNANASIENTQTGDLTTYSGGVIRFSGFIE